jgi:hypothetical protein
VAALMAERHRYDDLTLERVGANGFRFTVGAPALGLTAVVEGSCGPGNFPNWRNIVPAETVLTFGVAVAPNFLRAALATVAPDGTVGLTIRSAGRTGPVRIEAVGHPDQVRPFVVLMPLALGDAYQGDTPLASS